VVSFSWSFTTESIGVLMHVMVSPKLRATVVNVWTTHADAYNRSSSNLAIIYDNNIDVDSGESICGDIIVQDVDVNGVVVDRFGKIDFWAAEDTVYYLNSSYIEFPSPLKIYFSG